MFQIYKIIDKAEHTEHEYKKVKNRKELIKLCKLFKEINKGVCVRHNGIVC